MAKSEEYNTAFGNGAATTFIAGTPAAMLVLMNASTQIANGALWLGIGSFITTLAVAFGGVATAGLAGVLVWTTTRQKVNNFLQQDMIMLSLDTGDFERQITQQLANSLEIDSQYIGKVLLAYNTQQQMWQMHYIASANEVITWDYANHQTTQGQEIHTQFPQPNIQQLITHPEFPQQIYQNVHKQLRLELHAICLRRAYKSGIAGIILGAIIGAAIAIAFPPAGLALATSLGILAGGVTGGLIGGHSTRFFTQPKAGDTIPAGYPANHLPASPSDYTDAFAQQPSAPPALLYPHPDAEVPRDEHGRFMV